MEFVITRTDNTVTINSYTDTQPDLYKVETDALNNRVLISTEGRKWEINLNSDTVTVNGDAFGGNAAALKTLLYSDVFADLGGAASPGGSGLALESYENSAMSAPVMAYVFRDEDDNIYKVYEPIRNNIVSRSQYSYADSIDKFPFDNENNYGNNWFDVKVNQVPHASSIFQNSKLETLIIDAPNIGTIPMTFTSVDTGAKTFVIDESNIAFMFPLGGVFIVSNSTGNDKKYTVASTNNGNEITVVESIPSAVADGGISGMQIINHTQKGKYGADTNTGAEIDIEGDNVYLIGNICSTVAYAGQDFSVGFFNNVGSMVCINGNSLTMSDLEFNGHSKISIINSHYLLNSGGGFNADGCSIISCLLETQAYFDAWGVTYNNVKLGIGCYCNGKNSIISSSVGIKSSFDNTGGITNTSSIGDNCNVTTVGAITGKNYIALSGTTYVIGISGSNQTLTAV